MAGVGLFRLASGCLAFCRLQGWVDAKSEARRRDMEHEAELVSKWAEAVKAHGEGSEKERAASAAYSVQRDKSRAAFKARLAEAEAFLRARHPSAPADLPYAPVGHLMNTNRFMAAITRTFTGVFSAILVLMGIIFALCFGVPAWWMTYGGLPMWWGLALSGVGCVVSNLINRRLWAFRKREKDAFDQQCRLFSSALLLQGSYYDTPWATSRYDLEWPRTPEGAPFVLFDKPFSAAGKLYRWRRAARGRFIIVDAETGLEAPLREGVERRGESWDSRQFKAA